MDLCLVGIPTSETSLSPTAAHLTPNAVREALRRYSEHLVSPGDPQDRGNEVEQILRDQLNIRDAGNLSEVDTESGETDAASFVQRLAERTELIVSLGGDNACTVPATLGMAMAHGGLESAGLITLDAHHDLRDGRSNGSPVRRLVEMGLDGRRVVQIGIADFANSGAYRARAKELGITIIHRDEFFSRSIEDIAREALDVASSGGGPVHLDLDVDVCDRSVAPGCPASLPGGLQAHELRRITRALAQSAHIRSADIAEVDASADASDSRTIRLAALLVLELAAGLIGRTRRTH